MDPDIEKLVSAKLLWKQPKQAPWMFYCPLCRSQRALPCPPQPSGRKHGLQIGLTAAIFTLVTWHWFAWKGFVSFFPMWVAFEAIYRTKVRGTLNCSHCGFDPYLYMVDVKRARNEVESHWKAKFAEKGIPYPDGTRAAAPSRQDDGVAPPAPRPSSPDLGGRKGS